MLDVEPAGSELTNECAKKLVAAAGGWRSELVKESEICPPAAGGGPVRLDPSAARELATGTASRPRNGAKLHG